MKHSVSPKTWVFIVIGIVLVAWFVITYNGAVNKDENAGEAWGNVGTAVQRRLDLYPVLNAAVVGGAEQELEVFQSLERQAAALTGVLRYDAAGNVLPPRTPEEAEAYDVALNNYNTALINAMSYTADNPDIVSVQLFENFMVQAEGTENRIAVARTRYNEAVKEARSYCRRLPNNIVCNIGGMNADNWVTFEASGASHQGPPDVDFSTNND